MKKIDDETRKRYRAYAASLRNTWKDHAGETPVLSWAWEGEDGVVFSTPEPLKEPHPHYHVGIDVEVADGCVLAHVPAFEGQQQPDTAAAIAGAGEALRAYDAALTAANADCAHWHDAFGRQTDIIDRALRERDEAQAQVEKLRALLRAVASTPRDPAP